MSRLTSDEREAIWWVWENTKAFETDFKDIKKAYQKNWLISDIAEFVAKKYPERMDDILSYSKADHSGWRQMLSGCGKRKNYKKYTMDGLVPEGYSNVSKANLAKELKKKLNLSETTIKNVIDAYWGAITKALKDDKTSFIRINNIGSFRIVKKSYNAFGKSKRPKTTEKVKFEPSKNMENLVIRGTNTTKKRTGSHKSATKKATTKTTTKNTTKDTTSTRQRNRNHKKNK